MPVAGRSRRGVPAGHARGSASPCAGHRPAPYDQPVILRCTKKLLATIGAKLVDDQAPAPDPEAWYANIACLDGRACLLLTHAATLFTVVEAGVGAPELRSPHRLVTGLIARELLSEGLPPATFGDLDAEPLRLAKTADRRVLDA